MLKRYQNAHNWSQRVADACVVVSAWLAAYGLRFMFPFELQLPIAVTKGDPAFAVYAALSPVVAALWITVLTLTGAYEAELVFVKTREVQLVLRAHVVALLLFIALTYFFKYDKYSRLVMLYFAVLGGMGLLTLRMALLSHAWLSS